MHPPSPSHTHTHGQGADKVARRGYWGDIVSSPYLSFGVESHNKELFTRHNGNHIKVGVQMVTVSWSPYVLTRPLTVVLRPYQHVTLCNTQTYVLDIA